MTDKLEHEVSVVWFAEVLGTIGQVWHVRSA